MDNVKDNMLLSYECTTKLFLIPRKNAFDLVLWPTCCIETAECRCLMHPCVNVPLSPDNHFVQITKNLAHRICPVNNVSSQTSKPDKCPRKKVRVSFPYQQKQI